MTEENEKKEKVLITITSGPYQKLKKRLKDFRLTFSDTVDELISLTNEAIETGKDVTFCIGKPIKKVEK